MEKVITTSNEVSSILTNVNLDNLMKDKIEKYKSTRWLVDNLKSEWQIFHQENETTCQQFIIDIIKESQFFDFINWSDQPIQVLSNSKTDKVWWVIIKLRWYSSRFGSIKYFKSTWQVIIQEDGDSINDPTLIQRIGYITREWIKQYKKA